MQEKKEDKNKKASVLSVILWLMCGISIGLCIVFTADMEEALGESIGSFLVLYGLYALLSVTAFSIQIIIHEAGHLVFGLLSGYGFSSFRVFSLTITRKDGKLTAGNKKVAGTGGQCLMEPPEYNDGNYPHMMYNLGGVILNLISSVIFGVLFIVLRDIPVLNTLLAELAVIGVFYALVNGIPMQTKEVPNDGYNALHTGDTEASRRSFWTQLKMSAMSFAGVRAKDMPEEYFFLPSEEDSTNAIVSSSAVFYEYRLMDSGRYEEANELCHKLLDGGYNMPGIHRNLMTCDRIVTDLLLQNGKCTAEEMKDPKMIAFLKKLTVSPEVFRTRYVISLLLDNDEKEADKSLEAFEKMAQSYPNQGDIDIGRDIMSMAREIHAQENAGAAEV